jgi:hypothetical protein
LNTANKPVQWTLVTPAYLDTAWRVCAPWLIQAIGGEDQWDQISEIQQDVFRNAMQLWVVQCQKSGDVLAVFVTEPQLVGRVKTLVVRWAGGKEIDTWLEDLAVVERWAQRNDFAAVQIWGRPGWGRRFSRHGYQESYRVIMKKLGKELH